MADMLTVGMPVYNGEKYVGDAIRSLLDQSYQDFTLLISDNASSDATPDICRAYAASDARVRYHRNEKNIGPVRNFLSLVDKANSDYFMWAAYDDLWSRDWLEAAVSALERNPDAAFALSEVILKSINYKVWRTVPANRFSFIEEHTREERVLQYLNRHIYSHKTNMVYSLMRLPVLREAVALAGFPSGEVLGAAIMWLAPGVIMENGKFVKRYPKKWPAMFINRHPRPEKVLAFEASRDERFQSMKEIFPELESALEVIRANYQPRTFGPDYRIVSDEILEGLRK